MLKGQHTYVCYHLNIYLCMWKTELTENSNFHFIAAKKTTETTKNPIVCCKRKQKTEACFSWSANDKTVIDDSCFSKRARLRLLTTKYAQYARGARSGPRGRKPNYKRELEDKFGLLLATSSIGQQHGYRVLLN
jgi:hypothetical protein